MPQTSIKINSFRNQLAAILTGYIKDIDIILRSINSERKPTLSALELFVSAGTL